MSEKLRVAAQQALKCLKGVARGKYDGNAAGVCATLEAALSEPEPVQEPVAWLDQDINWAYTAVEMDGDSTNGLVPLYTAPPQRPPLTDDEISVLFSEAVQGDKSVHWLCRAVERAVRGEKE